MYGAMIGDIAGSKYEFHNIKTKQFPLFSTGCDFTDDTIMTVAVAQALMACCPEAQPNGAGWDGLSAQLVRSMQALGRRYPNPTGAYGGHFAMWLRADDPQPYGSFGNGSAMRASPCGLIAVTLEEALTLARISACVTHDHPEGIKGAEAAAAAVFLAKSGKSKADIREFITERYYPLDFTLDEIRPGYSFDVTCQGSVPQAIEAFLESVSFEDAIRNVISIGGDCDTTGAITGSIAWTYYAVQSGGPAAWKRGELPLDMAYLLMQAKKYLPAEFIDAAEAFHRVCVRRMET